MDFEYLSLDATAPIARLALDRPERRNALSLDLMLELIACLDSLAQQNDVRVIILAAAGKVFSSGHDLTELQANVFD